MFAGRKITRSPVFILLVSIIFILSFGALACQGTSPEPTVPLPPPADTAAAPPPTAAPAAEEEQQAAPAEAQPEDEAAPETALDQEVVGFWRAKITGKQVIVFEFQDGGGMIWHYRYNNGEVRNLTGTYTVSGSEISVDVGGEQTLVAQLDGGTLTLTGPDDKPLVMQRVAGVDSPSPTASTDIAADIIGRWQDQAAQEWIEFKPGASVVITSGSNTISGSYSVSGSTLAMKLDNQDESSTFLVEIDGSILTLIAQDGSFTDYIQ